MCRAAVFAGCISGKRSASGIEASAESLYEPYRGWPGFVIGFLVLSYF